MVQQQQPVRQLFNALPLIFFLCVRALESLKIMDYSLLVGIHNIDQAVAGGGGEWCSNSSPPISWHPDEGGRRPAMLERIGTNIQQNYFCKSCF